LTEQTKDKKNLATPPGETRSAPPSATALQERPTDKPVGVSAPGRAEEEPHPVSLEDALKEAADNRDRWMRSLAELENFRKRAAHEKSRLLKYKNEDLLRDLLGVVDNMDRALGHCRDSGRSDPLADGVCMISGMFHDLLQRYGVSEINALGEPFNPHLHEALAKIPSADHQANTVVEVLEKGYLYEDRLLRPAKVAVAAPPVAAEEPKG
jgi:molecular chaperone GrpE